MSVDLLVKQIIAPQVEAYQRALSKKRPSRKDKFLIASHADSKKEIKHALALLQSIAKPSQKEQLLLAILYEKVNQPHKAKAVCETMLRDLKPLLASQTDVMIGTLFYMAHCGMNQEAKEFIQSYRKTCESTLASLEDIEADLNQPI